MLPVQVIATEPQTIIVRVSVEPEHRADFKSLSKPLLFEELAKHFDISADEAAEKLGVCMSAIKKICRRHGIIRWPHRKLHSANKAILVIESKISETQDMAAVESLRREAINILVSKLRVILNPTYILSSELVQHSNSRDGDMGFGLGMVQDDDSSEDESGVVQATVVGGSGFPTNLPGMSQGLGGAQVMGVLGGIEMAPTHDSVAKIVMEKVMVIPVSLSHFALLASYAAAIPPSHRICLHSVSTPRSIPRLFSGRDCGMSFSSGACARRVREPGVQ